LILCDHHIEKARKEGRVIIDPPPGHDQYNSSSVDLHVGDDFVFWKKSLSATGSRYHVDVDQINLLDVKDLLDQLPPAANGAVVIPPGQLILVRTREVVSLPLGGKLAARVEGRSKMARLGLPFTSPHRRSTPGSPERSPWKSSIMVPSGWKYGRVS
jgi:dCTP deaminase